MNLPSPGTAPAPPTPAAIDSDTRPPIVWVAATISMSIIRIGVGIRILRRVGVVVAIGRSRTDLHVVRPFVVVRTHPAERLRRGLGRYRHGSFNAEGKNLLRIKVRRAAPRHQYSDDSDESPGAGADRSAPAPIRRRAYRCASRGGPCHCAHVAAHGGWAIFAEPLRLKRYWLSIQ